jgi:alpha-1,3-mannosyltransferase
MLFCFAAILLFVFDHWSLGCLLFSFGVSVKMNVLLFAPGLLVLLLKRFKAFDVFKNLAICGGLQVYFLLFPLVFPLLNR